MPEIKSITIGENRTFNDATAGIHGQNGIQIGEVTTRIDVEKNAAYAAADAYIAGMGLQGYAEVGTVFEVNGPSDQEQDADIIIHGDYLMEGLGVGAGSARLQGKIFLLDLTASGGVVDLSKAKSVDNYILRDDTATALWWESLWPGNDPNADYPDVDGFKEEVNGTLKTGNIYYAGVLANAWAMGDYYGYGTADIYTDTDQTTVPGETDCFINYNDITVEWDNN